MEDDENNKKQQENHMALGMGCGMLAGTLAMSILSMFGYFMWGGACIGLGLLAGMLIGMNISKKK